MALGINRLKAMLVPVSSLRSSITIQKILNYNTLVRKIQQIPSKRCIVPPGLMNKSPVRCIIDPNRCSLSAKCMLMVGKKMPKRSVTITDTHDEWLKAHVASGQYRPESEVISDLIREQQQRNVRVEPIRLAMIEDEQCGPGTPTPEDVRTAVQRCLRKTGSPPMKGRTYVSVCTLPIQNLVTLLGNPR